MKGSRPRTDGVARIDATGIHTTQGTHSPLDVIVYATGYHATDGVLTYPVAGRGGVTLAQRWEAFPRAYLGTTVPDFPNLFLVTGPNTGIGHTSAVFIIESQMRYIVRAIREVLDRGAQTIEAEAAAEDAYTTWVHEAMEGTVWKTGGCTSWYQSNDGHVIAMFPGFSMTFWRWCGQFKEADHTFG